jgi:hypothetical protein
LAAQVPVGGKEQVPLPHCEPAEHWHTPPTQELLAQPEFCVHDFGWQVPDVPPLQVSMERQSVAAVQDFALQFPAQVALAHCEPPVHSQ